MKSSSLCNFIAVLITVVAEASSQCDHTLKKCEIHFNSPNARGSCPPEIQCDTYSCATEYARGYEVHILGIYKPIGGWRGFQRPPGKVGNVTVNIVHTSIGGLPLKLVLSSYEAANWQIHVSSFRRIEDIQLYSYYESYSTITVFGTIKQPRKVLTHGYLGYGDSRIYSQFWAVQRRFGYITSLTGTYTTDSWILNVGLDSPCSPTQKPDEYAVRLVDGDESSGTVQLYVSGTWVELHETADSTNVANVACRQLFNGRVNVRRPTYNYCPTSLWWTTASCHGSENELSQCWLPPLLPSKTTPACNKSAVRVRCDTVSTHPGFTTTTTERDMRPSVGDLRLVDGGHGYGRVEIYFFSKWGTICDDEWGDEEADVVCKTLGFPGGGKTRFYGPGTGYIWLNRVNCAPADRTFEDCSRTWPSDNQGVVSCTHAEDVGVECSSDEFADGRSNGMVIGFAVTFTIITLILIVFVVRFVIKRYKKKQQSARAVRYDPSNESVTEETDIRNVRQTLRDSTPASHVAPANPARSEPHFVHPSPVHPSAPPPPDYYDQAPPSYQDAVHFSRPTAPPSDTADPPRYDALFTGRPNQMSASNL